MKRRRRQLHIHEKDPQEMSGRELTAVLAALRLAQHGMFNDAFRNMPHWDDDEQDPLSADEIDDLCERLNEVIPTRRS